jgi:hypothetical protein
MTESEWLSCQDPQPMLEFLRGKASDRKLRLFAVACCRRVQHLMTNEYSRTAVEVSERYADGQAGYIRLDLARLAAQYAMKGSADRAAWLAAHSFGFGSWVFGYTRERIAVETAVHAAASTPWQLRSQCGILRDFVGPLLFRSVSLNPSWFTSTVTSLAQSIYTDRSFDQLPILADALEEQGCTDAELLRHLRSAGPHVRGCWALDAVLGKE